MKKALLTGLGVSVILLVLSYAILLIGLRFFPSVCEEYYNPTFQSGEGRTLLYFLHPFILGFALLWFWYRFKGIIAGSILLRGLEFGLAYGVVATLPSMWITFSALNVSAEMVLIWFVYSVLQAFIAGLVFARTNP
ncbi:hypothetical protein C7N43_29600 [Sphingobacteriales bacterium UPWRP_1]|nr:hypothetical protein BVG80_18530 [Sphingobacteriales bacterium TSM_CSM]PSJ73337.1 hypothetical protein C7N43_29600 [Sphingobacteriales bacterium UPWRP_1]